MVFLVILIISFLLHLILPWWICVVISFATCGLIAKTGKIALWSPFFATGLLWLGMAIYKSYPNDNMLAGKVAAMFGIGSWWLILIIMGLLGGFVSAISGFCGYHFRKAVLIKKPNL